MARVTVEDCLEQVDNRFELIMLASKRARQLAMNHADSKVDWENDKATVVALREIADGFVTTANIDTINARDTEQDDQGDEATTA